MLWLLEHGGTPDSQFIRSIDNQLDNLARLEREGNTAELDRLRANAPNAHSAATDAHALASFNRRLREACLRMTSISISGRRDCKRTGLPSRCAWSYASFLRPW